MFWLTKLMFVHGFGFVGYSREKNVSIWEERKQGDKNKTIERQVISNRMLKSMK